MRIAFFSATMLASSLALAAIPIDGWYGSVFGGYSYLQDNISRTRNTIDFDRASYANGYNVGGRVGFQTSPLRYEGEVTYLYAGVKSFRHDRFRNRFLQNRTGRFFHHRRNGGGHSSAALGMANIYYDFPEMVPCIAPYIGVGIGYGWVEVNLNNESRPFFRRVHFEESGSAFAYQATAGLSYNFTEAYSLNLAYRYVGTTRIHDFGKTFQANLASVGVIYRFNEYNYK